MSDKVTYRLEDFSSPTIDLDDIAALHSELLPHSPVVLLGDEFMKRFYYGKLPQSQLIVGAMAYVDDVPAGFIAATHDAGGFMKRAIGRHGGLLVRVLLGQLLARPARIASLWEAVKVMRHSDATGGGGDQMGEILSFGVREQFRGRQFVRETGIRVSVDLMKRATTQLAAHGVRRIRAVVDPGHLESKFFYAALGWRPTRELHGRKIPVLLEYVWERDYRAETPAPVASDGS